MPQAGPHNAFEGGMDGGEHAARPVGGAGGVLGEVVVSGWFHVHADTPRLCGAALVRVPKLLVPASCSTGQAHCLPGVPEAHGAMIIRADAEPPLSRFADLMSDRPPTQGLIKFPERRGC